MTTYAQAVQAAGESHAQSLADLADVARTRGPEAVADRAWYPGHPLTREQITGLVRELAGLPPVEQAA